MQQSTAWYRPGNSRADFTLNDTVSLHDVLSPGYETVDDGTVWAIVRHDVPVVIKELATLIRPG